MTPFLDLETRVSPFAAQQLLLSLDPLSSLASRTFQVFATRSRFFARRSLLAAKALGKF